MSYHFRHKTHPPSSQYVEQGRGRQKYFPVCTKQCSTSLRCPHRNILRNQCGCLLLVHLENKFNITRLRFHQLDPENTGFIAVENFTSLVEHHELQLDPSKLDMLLALVQSNEEGQVCYQELIELMSSKRSSSFRRAIANGRRTLQREILLDETGLGLYKRFVRYVAYEILPCETDRRWYFHQNRLCPPPVFIAIVTIVQIIVFMCYGIMLNKWVLQTYQPDFMKSPLVYHPGHRAQVWRFFSYMFMHVGLEQLGFNALLQLMIGVPLEMVHGILRISLLYMAGVLAGSLTVSITDMRAPVVGGSGGVYALCSAHLANVVMNWAGMRCPYKLLRMILALVCTEETLEEQQQTTTNTI
ncbi:rhomboid-related protein 1 isoform X3 [Dicentrarchus labrax]|uniref:rhomboid-related protein 1 isoform X3 n=1 Tax=Dicentrarchus labrax TaxID=13489 RepID=UPI0021F5D203|nr:rhomboid-related protein 1 isoform X3 [Dicentrarchus labrax]